MSNKQLRFVRHGWKEFLRQSSVLQIVTATVLLRLLLLEFLQQQVVNGRVMIVCPIPQRLQHHCHNKILTIHFFYLLLSIFHCEYSEKIIFKRYSSELKLLI